ncbi:hypothetical protein CCHR01_15764 [Colletotrichum chrysophilum]|uniref:Uncharacterized protein n=1 Tax=Colletotrichum chrysophilum TaxID=1836956 RepID=A0AAD9A5Z2_9PEZI|nr:hypothetical protein CCHR01_15764 [Colletotrichum chrysophilum]
MPQWTWAVTTSVWTWKHRTCNVGTPSGSCLPAPGPGSGRAEAAPCKKRPADAPVSVVSPSSVVGARPPHQGLPGSSLGLGPAPEVRCLPWVPLPLQTVPSSELRIPTYCGNGNQTTVVTANSPPSWHFPAIISSNPFMGAASGHFQCPVFLFLPTSYTTLVQFPSSTVHWMDTAGVKKKTRSCCDVLRDVSLDEPAPPLLLSPGLRCEML